MPRHKERSKTGCTSCLRRKIKCDEQLPTCRQCLKAKVKCSWDLSSRIRVQNARRRCKTTTHVSASTESRCPSGVDRAGSYACNLTFFGWSQRVSCEYNLPKVPILEEEDVAWPCTLKNKVPVAVPAWYIDRYCPNRHSTLGMPSPLSFCYFPPPSLPCANSVLLSHQGRLYLEYFSASSLVNVLGKAYAWSNFRYICQNKASADATVMYAVMALSASELNQSLRSNNNHDEGRVYYSLALQGVANGVSNLTFEPYSMEAVLSALLLIIAYEWRFGSFISNLEIHIQGLIKYLGLFSPFCERRSNTSVDLTTCPFFTPFCAQVLLWILYIESSCIHGNLSFKLMDHLHMSRGDLQLHNLFTFARHSYIFIHGEMYTTEQQQDDLKNYCPLELINQDYLFRYRIWRLSQRYQRGEPIHSELGILWREINVIRKGFDNLFLLQKAPPTEFRRRRAFITLSEGIAGYYCNVLLIHRLFRYRIVPVESHFQVLSELFDICYTIHEWYPADPTLGFAWYLLIAGLETKDRIHRQWAYDRLQNLGERWDTCKWAENTFRLVHDQEGDVRWPEDNDPFLNVFNWLPK